MPEAAEGEPIGSGYVLISPIGSGAMGHVWRASSRTGDPVAIKLLRPELTRDPAFVSRFLQEAQILTQVRNEHVVAVRDLVAEGSRIAIVMDLIDGPDLRQSMTARGPLPSAAAVVVADQILAGVAAVHAAGIVHRDLKPENVLLAPGSTLDPRITDFGVARLIEEGPAARSTAVIGTPDYISPEVADGQVPTPASDLYAIGILLYEMLCGITPFAGGSPLAVMRRHVDQAPGRPEGLTDSLWAVISDLLAKNPAARPGSAEEARERLAAVAPAEAGREPLSRLTVAPVPSVPLLPTVVGARPVGTDPLATQTDRPRRRRAPVLLGVLAAVLAAGGVTAYMLNRQDPRPVVPVAASIAAGTPGTAGSASAPTDISSTPTGMASTTSDAVGQGFVPAGVGRQLDPVTTEMEQAGLSVEIKEVLDDAKADNLVVDQLPAAGAPLPGDRRVTLTVSRKSVGLYLADTQPVEGSIETANSTVNGKIYVHSVHFNEPGCFSGTESVSAQYDLGRHYRQFKATAGLDDTSGSASKVRMEVLGDGRSLFTFDAALGKTKPVSVDVTGVLRLEVRATRLTECADTPWIAAFGDAQLFGVPSEVPTPTPTAS